MNKTILGLLCLLFALGWVLGFFTHETRTAFRRRRAKRYWRRIYNQ